MPVTLQRQESTWLIRLEGRVTLTSAAELKEVLLEWLSAGKNLELDLEPAEEIDITIMQLLWAAGREAARTGVKILIHRSSAVAMAIRDAGFDQLPGFPVSE
jgi:anti-anti-sigma regulatory factor